MASILIVEDEQMLGQTLRASLTDEGHDVHWVPAAEDAATWLRQRQVDLALVDLRLPGRDGIWLLEQLTQSHPDTVVVLMTAHGDVQTAVRAMKLGAADFLMKPVDLDAVTMVAAKNLRQSRLARQVQHEQQRGSQEFGLHRIVGDSPGIRKAKELVQRLAKITSGVTAAPPNVFVTGETGTGKDLIARAVHYEGPRRHGPFVHMNCAALPETLAESELFGHIKGAFTDARANKRGLFEVADQGTLFLDEVCSLPLGLQAKLLTAIETRRIRAVGACEERAVDVHLVAAMNQDATALIAEGRFRDDLYHRLRVIHIDLPPLRERGEDIFLLAEHLVADHGRAFQIAPKPLTAAARKALRAYHWPGNVRELSHRLETAVLLSGECIDETYLPAAASQAQLQPNDRNGEILTLDFTKGPIPLESVEREMMVRALVAANDNVSRAAELLQVSRDTMRYRMDKFGLVSKRTGAIPK